MAISNMIKTLLSILATGLTVITCKDQSAEISNQVQLTVFMEEEIPRTSAVINLSSLLKRTLSNASQYFPPVQDADIRFSFLEPNSQFFIDYTNPSAQTLRTHARVDRETICPAVKELCPSQFPNAHSSVSYNLQQQVSSSCTLPVLLIAEMHPVNAAVKTVSQLIVQLNIYILDINDNAPSWRSFSSTMISLQQLNNTPIPYNSLASPNNAVIPKMELKIAEHTAIGTRLALPLAVDPDACPENTTASYGIESQTIPDAFVLDWDQTTRDSAKTTESGLWLRVNRDLDHDDQTHHQVVIFAADAGIPRRLTGHLLLNITVTDVNDHPPKFAQQRDTVWVREHELIGSKVYQPKVHDADPSDQLRLSFGFLPSTVSSTRSLFNLNPKNGDITVQGVIDFEQSSQHKLLIFVSDGKWTDEMELTVLVLNLNDHAPHIKLYSHLASVSKDPGSFHAGSRNFMQAQLTVVVQENGPPNQLIATATVTDKDVSAQLRAEDLLESQDTETHLNEEQSGLIFSMKKIKTPKPVCTVDNDQFVMESLQLDSPQKSRDRFRFKISLAGKSLDREKQDRIMLQIQCYDEDTVSQLSNYPHYMPSNQAHQQGLFLPIGRRSASASLLIIVTDENDSPPVIIGSQVAKLPENAPIDTLVMRIHATDADDTHSMAGSTGLRYQLNGEPLIFLTSSGPSTTSMGCRLSELIASGGENFPSLPWFHLNPLNGDLKTLVSFDREIIQSILLPIIVTDGGDQVVFRNTGDNSEEGSSKQSKINAINGTVKIEIVDVNDCFPTFNQQLYEFNLSEDSRPPIRVGRVNVTDCDVDENNRLLEFWLQSSMPRKQKKGITKEHSVGSSIANKNSQLLSWFSVSKSGELFVRMPHFSQTGFVSSQSFNPDDYSPLDRERNEIIVLDIYARDSGSPALTGSAQILIRVLDVNDHAPEWEFPRPQHRLVNLSADAAVGNRVTRLIALDPDEGPRGKITYSLLSGNEAGQFELDSESGWIYLAQPIDGQNRAPLDGQSKYYRWQTRSASMIRLYVQASDHGDPPRTSSSVLDILVQRPAPLRTMNSQSNSIKPADNAHHSKHLDYRESRSDVSSAQLHSDTYFDLDRPTGGLLLSSDFLTLVAMITATLAALLLIFILFVVIRCRKLKQTRATVERPGSRSEAKFGLPEHDASLKMTDGARCGMRSTIESRWSRKDYFGCFGRPKSNRRLTKSQTSTDPNSTAPPDTYFPVHLSSTLNSRQPFNFSEKQGHRLTDVHSSDIFLYSTKSSLVNPCQTIPRAGLDSSLNANEYSFLVHSSCPIEDQSVCPGMLLNNSNHYKPQTFYPHTKEVDFQLFSSTHPEGPFESSEETKQTSGSHDSHTLEQGTIFDKDKYIATVRMDKGQSDSIYTALSPDLTKPKSDSHTVFQSSSFV